MSDEVISMKQYKDEFKRTLKLSWCLVLNLGCILALQPVSTKFASNFGDIHLSAVALSNTIINVLGCTIAIGMSSGAVTLFSQAFKANSLGKVYGIILHKSITVNMFTSIILSMVFLNIEPILLFFDQDKQIARLTAIYLINFLPGLFCLFITMSFYAYLQCQDKALPCVIISAVTLGTLIILQYIFVILLDLGLRGSSVAQSLCYVLNLLMIMAYMCVERASLPWSELTWEFITDLADIVKFGIYGIQMSSYEWWAFEITIIVAGTMGTNELGVQSIILNILSLAYSIMQGMSLGISIRIGQSIHLESHDNALICFRVGFFIAGSISLIMFLIIYLLGDFIVHTFVNYKDIVRMSLPLMPYLASYCALSNFGSLFRAALRGLRQQLLGTCVTFLSYYLIALPIGLPLLLCTHYGLKGIWIGLIIGISIGNVLHLMILFCLLDWKDIILKIKYPREREYLLSLASKSTGGYTQFHVDIDPTEFQSKITAKFILKSIILILTLFISVVLSMYVHFHYKHIYNYIVITTTISSNHTIV